MTTAQIIAQMRRKSGVDEVQYPDTDALIDLNTRKNEFWSKICSKKKKLNWQEWKSDSVALQSEYTLAEVTSTTEWTKLLEWVAINYNWETYDDLWTPKYIKATKVEKNELEKDWDYYVENQSELSPIFYKADNSYFIAPAPRTAVTNWIKLTWIRNIADYTLSTTEAEMKLPIDIHTALVYWLIVDALENKRVEEDKIISAENRRIQKRDEALDAIMNDVDEWAWINEYPDEISDEITFN